MDNYQLKGLINLLERFRTDYTLDSETEFVHIPNLIKKINNKLEG